MYGFGGLGQEEVGERRRRAKWLKKEKEKTKDRSAPDGSNKNIIFSLLGSENSGKA